MIALDSVGQSSVAWSSDSAAANLLFSPDARWLAGWRDKDLLVWDVGDGRLLNSLHWETRGPEVFAWAPHRPLMAAGFRDGGVAVWHTTMDSSVIAEHPDLRRLMLPKDDFEREVDFRARMDSARVEYNRLLAMMDETAAAERESRIVGSRELLVNADSAVRLGSYDPEGGFYEVLVEIREAESTARRYGFIEIPAADARDLRDRLGDASVEAVSQLSPDLSGSVIWNVQIVHPVNGKRYPLGPQIAMADAPVTVARVTAPAVLEVLEPKFTDADGDNRLAAGERAVFEFRLRNTGQGPAQAVRVLGTTTASIDGLRASLGTIEPGATRAVTLSIIGGETLKDTTAVVALEVKEANGFDAPPLTVRIPTRAFRPPSLIVAGTGVEDAEGRAVIRAQQPVKLTIRVQNAGAGRAEQVTAQITAGPNVFLAESDGRTIARSIGDLEPGAYRDVTVQAFANAQAGTTFPVTVALRERTGRYTAAAKDLGLTQQTVQRTVAELEITALEVPGAGGAAAAAANALTSGLLANIPAARTPNPDAIAVIIGNRNYRSAPPVAFAANDAAAVRQYAERALGISPGNIIMLDDASLSDLKRLFGDRGNPNGRLRQLVKRGQSEVFVFYSGHGAPEPASQGAYLMPVDADANALPLTGMPLDVVYDNLAALGAKHVTVVLDACFSGASGGGEMLITSASPIGITVRNPAARFGADGNATIISAAEGQQLASWYPEMRHGMLTYFFLQGLQGAADSDGDGAISVGEMRTWLTDPTKGLPYQARLLHGRDQMPQVWGTDTRVIRR